MDTAPVQVTILREEPSDSENTKQKGSVRNKIPLITNQINTVKKIDRQTSDGLLLYLIFLVLPKRQLL